MTTTPATEPVQAPVEQASAYRAHTLVLAALAADQMTAAVGLPVPDGEFAAVGAAVVARAVAAATVAADLSLAAVLAAPGSVPLPLGLLPGNDTAAKAHRGLTTLLAGLPGEQPTDGEAAAGRRGPITARAVRLARSESLDAGRVAYRTAMTRRRVSGWVRVTGPDPCRLCADLAARGEVLPPDHRLATHVGCSCVQRPTTAPPTRGRTDAA